jgi:hypothetical protein
MFKDHPNRSTITFVVLPIVHELLHTSNDMSADIEVILKKYAPKQPICEGLVFDFT